jgi:hypothetical protein
MKSSIVLTIALISVSLPLAAQQEPDATEGQREPAVRIVQMSPTTIRILQDAENCPAILNIQHLSDGSMIRTSNGTGHTHPSGIGQWLHITIMTPTVATATLLVRGFSDKARVTQADNKSGAGTAGPNANGPNATRTVTVTFPETGNGQATGNVWVPGLTAVDSIDLTSMTYVNGNTWSAPSGHTCSVTPDPLMLISGR